MHLQRLLLKTCPNEVAIRERLLRGDGRVRPLRHSALPRWWDSNPRFLRTHVPWTPIKQSGQFQKTDRRSDGQRFYVALPLSYSDPVNRSCWRDSNPRPTACKACTPNRQSIRRLRDSKEDSLVDFVSSQPPTFLFFPKRSNP